jgi:hypothetical protein
MAFNVAAMVILVLNVSRETSFEFEYEGDMQPYTYPLHIQGASYFSLNVKCGL